MFSIYCIKQNNPLQKKSTELTNNAFLFVLNKFITIILYMKIVWLLHKQFQTNNISNKELSILQTISYSNHQNYLSNQSCCNKLFH